MKKNVVISIILIVLILLAVGTVLASTNIELSISCKDSELKEGQEIMITARLENYEGIKEGMNCYKATLDYNKEIFEEVSENNFQTKNNWEELKYNKETGEFIAIKKAGSKEPEEILQIALQVKEGVKATKTEVKVKDIVTSEGQEDIFMNEVGLTFDILEDQGNIPEEPDKPDKITSERYTIKESYITGILPGTTVAEFKQNVETESELVFLDELGAELQDDSIIPTGIQLKVGTTLQYTLIVKGDIDEDSEITINDLACAKLHLIGYEELTGKRWKAADIDGDEEITINDIAQYKLILLGLLELGY